MTDVDNSADGLLRGSLRANAVFSMASGLIGSVYAGVVAEFMGVATIVVLVVSVGVFVFGVATWLNSRRSPIRLTEARLTVIADFGWVLGAAVLIFAFPELMTTGGKLLLGGISLIVGLLALLQAAGLRALSGPSRSRSEWSRVSEWAAKPE